MWYKNTAGRFFGLSQSTRVTDRQTDRRTDRRTDRENYDSQDRASIAASRGKNGSFESHPRNTGENNVRNAEN